MTKTEKIEEARVQPDNRVHYKPLSQSTDSKHENTQANTLMTWLRNSQSA